jgi:hypothetical protein
MIIKPEHSEWKLGFISGLCQAGENGKIDSESYLGMLLFGSVHNGRSVLESSYHQGELTVTSVTKSAKDQMGRKL